VRGALVLAVVAALLAAGGLAYTISAERETFVPAARDCLERDGAQLALLAEPPPFLRRDARFGDLEVLERRALDEELVLVLLRSTRGTVVAIGEQAEVGGDAELVLRIATEPRSLALLAFGRDAVVRACVRPGVED
jgi:hypothetical protein